MVIATKKRKPRGVPVHERGITLIETMRIEKGWDREELAGKAGFKDKKTIDRALQGIPIDENSIEKIARALGIDFNDLIDLPPKKVSTHSQSSLDNNLIGWQKICGEMLRKQKEARQLRKEATAIGAEVSVYVPLDLLEHKEQTRSKQDKADSDQRNQYQELKVLKTYEHNDFLRSLTDRQSKNKHIAIVGEAGAGKTTLLARIADELDKNQKLQIFVSLADLRGQSLEEHIYGNWLSKALGMQKDSINSEQKNDLFQQFQSGEIWLLLDGLDEMRAKSSADALEKINREIREVIGQSRVVLTSRLNVWDAYLNRLSDFDTFRMGDFSPEQVDKFISDWFVAAEKPESAPILQAKLKEPNRDRIRDMVRHPLRLALLCQAFYRDQNTELPETKAGLYELFVRYFYEWKPNIVDEDLTQDTLREELHLALGKLAIAGIDGDAGFRLSRSLAVKEMGDRLFKLASNVGWLTLIERDEQDQEVYAFYHASFQEYFAALAINDWDFFVPSNHVDRPINDRYRLFESKWKYVLSLWEEIIHQEYKNEFLSKLAEFDDGCENYYGWKCVEHLDWNEVIDFDSDGEPNMYIETLPLYWDYLYITNKSDWYNSWDIYWDFLVKYLGIPNIELEKSFTGIPVPPQLVGICDDPLFLHLEIDLITLLPYITSINKSINIDNSTFLDLLETFKIDKINHIDKLKILAAIIQMCRQNTCLYNCLIEKFIYGSEFDVVTLWILDEIGFELLTKDIVSKIITKAISIITHTGNKLLQAIAARTLITFIYKSYSPDSESKFAHGKFENSIVSQIISRIRFLNVDDSNDPYNIAEWRNNIVRIFAENLSYPVFYEAWHSQPTSTHPEITDNIPSNNTNKIQTLESQLIDCEAIQKELDRNANHPEIRCLVVDVHHLEQESDPNIIAKKLTNKIFNSIGRRIPVVQDISCLERELLNLKFDLGVEKLAIALYGKSANEAITQLCQNLAPIQTRLFTGGQTTQELITQINAWLLEM